MEKIISENELLLELEDYNRLCKRKYDLLLQGQNKTWVSDSIMEASEDLKQSEFFLTLNLHEDLRKAISFAMFSNKSIFLTGRPGTGKSVFLDIFRSITKKNIGITAPTGVAAVNVSGMTLNSLFGLGFSFHGEYYYHDKDNTDHNKKPKLEISRERAELLFNIETLLIDEISMTRSDTLDAVSACFQLIHDNPAPFGGIQVIYIGDPFQLPPIADKEIKKAYKTVGYISEFFFHSKKFMEVNPKKIEFTKVFRQEEILFLDVLDKIRYKRMSDKDYTIFNANIAEIAPDPEMVSLCSTNASAKKINTDKFDQLSSSIEEFTGTTKRTFPKSMRIVPEDLKIKIGERIILLKNNWNQNFVNGDTGTITRSGYEDITYLFSGKELTKNEYCISVRLDSGRTVIVPEAIWYNVQRTWNHKSKKMEEEIIGEYKNYPIAPAWALTIHKSQGKTFNKVFIDFGKGTFTHGQAYVALSRCRTLEGLYLKNSLKPADLIIDNRVLSYIKGEVEIDLDQHEEELEVLFDSLCSFAENQEENPFKNDNLMHDFLFKISEKVLVEVFKNISNKKETI